MLLHSTGKYRVVLQQYECQSVQVFCVIKVLPDATSFFDEVPQKDFNWMSATRWAKLENILLKLISKLSNLEQNAENLNTDAIFDHIKVTIRVEKDLIPAARQLLKSGPLTEKEVYLDIELKYMPHSDSFVNALPTKRAHVVIEKYANNEGLDISCDSGSEPKKRTKTSKTPGETQNTVEKPQESRESVIKIRRRERRSVSQDSSRTSCKSTSKNVVETESNSRMETRTKSPRANSVESKRERPFRSPIQPSRYKEFVLGNINVEKNIKKPDPVDSSKKKPKKKPFKKTNVVEQPVTPVEPLNRDHLNADILNKMNTAFEVQEPRKVKVLQLNDMDEQTVLKSFEKYRVDFKVLFKERQHKFNTANYMSIDHCHIMDIMSNTIRESMIKKLGNEYSKKGPHASLILNGLLPLWVIRIFMDKFKLTKEEAVTQISAQLKYHTFLKALNNDPLGSDLDD